MFRAVPFNLRENAERGYDVLEKVLSYAAEQSLNPLGKVSGALSSFKVDVIETETAYELFAELPGFYKEQITGLEEQIETLKLSQAFVSGGNSPSASKEKIDKMIREIDRCISLLEKS